MLLLEITPRFRDMWEGGAILLVAFVVAIWLVHTTYIKGTLEYKISMWVAIIGILILPPVCFYWSGIRW